MNKTVLIFDIERFSATDGAGLRTVVFFKGCNMYCRWCHNPEGISSKPQLVYRQSKCIGCGKCVDACDQKAHTIIDHMHAFYPERCTECLACASNCYSGALSVAGKRMSVDDVMQEILQDKLLYETSGGGVTFSGGEVMLQADFLLELLKACKSYGIDTAIETNLNIDWSSYEEVIPYLDCIYADIKLADPAKHKEWTGVSNIRILENANHLIEGNAVFVIRTPVIPGVNDNVSDITDIASMLQNARHLKYYELLSYNNLGNSKGMVVNGPEILDFGTSDKKAMNNLAESIKSIVPTVLDGRRVS